MYHDLHCLRDLWSSNFRMSVRWRKVHGNSILYQTTNNWAHVAAGCRTWLLIGRHAGHVASHWSTPPPGHWMGPLAARWIRDKIISIIIISDEIIFQDPCFPADPALVWEPRTWRGLRRRAGRGRGGTSVTGPLSDICLENSQVFTLSLSLLFWIIYRCLRIKCQRPHKFISYKIHFGLELKMYLCRHVLAAEYCHTFEAYREIIIMTYSSTIYISEDNFGFDFLSSGCQS